MIDDMMHEAMKPKHFICHLDSLLASVLGSSAADESTVAQLTSHVGFQNRRQAIVHHLVIQSSMQPHSSNSFFIIHISSSSLHLSAHPLPPSNQSCCPVAFPPADAQETSCWPGVSRPLHQSQTSPHHIAMASRIDIKVA